MMINSRTSIDSRMRAPQATIRKHIALAVATFQLVSYATLSRFISNQSLITLSNIASLCAFTSLLMIWYVSSKRIWSTAFIYAFVFCLFHFGITMLYGLDFTFSENTNYYLQQWFFRIDTLIAIQATTLGLLAFNFAVQLVWWWERRHKRAEANTIVDTNYDRAFGVVGFSLVSLAVIIWFAVVLAAGGIALLGSSYEVYLAKTAAIPLPFSFSTLYYVQGLGMAFLAAVPRSRLRTLGFLCFGVWSTVALPLGLRGEVLFTTLATLAVLGMRRAPFSTRTAAVFALAILILIAGIKDFRQFGYTQVSWSQITVSPGEALAEMGASLRPVTEVVGWNADGDSLIHGASYWAPFDRALKKIIPFGYHPDGLEDERIMNVLVQRRVGPIGFSPVAESYYNFGQLGVALFMLITGLLIAKLDTWPATPARQVALGIVMIALLIQIRNDFIPVPSEIAIGLVLLYVTQWVARGVRGGRPL